MHTVDEAREKECPNGTKNYPNNKYCTVSKCMAWRWVKVESETPRKGMSAIAPPKMTNSTTHGYCGLAGEP